MSGFNDLWVSEVTQPVTTGTFDPVADNYNAAGYGIQPQFMGSQIIGGVTPNVAAVLPNSAPTSPQLALGTAQAAQAPGGPSVVTGVSPTDPQISTTPGTIGGGQAQGTWADVGIRIGVVILGFIFVGLGLSMMRGRFAPVIQAVKGK